LGPEVRNALILTLGPEVRNALILTEWQCEQGHCWQARYGDIQQGSGCPHCNNLLRKTPADYHTLAAERNFVWLGPEVPNIQTKTGWQCQQGHRWRAHYSSISRGSGCPHCAGHRPKTPADYQALAAERDFVWLGPQVANTLEPTEWQCQHGHRWRANYNSLSRGSGCPYCARGNRPSTRAKTSADYYALAQKRGFRWIGPEVGDTVTPTGWQCPQGHSWQAQYSNIQHGTGCPHCAGNARKVAADYHALAKKRNFVWLGPEVPNIQSPTGWQCPQGHHWQARYNNIQRGTGCPYCAGVVAKKTPDDYHTLAAQQGFVWLGPEVPNIQTKTGWQCTRGHQWQASYARIRQGGRCPECAV
jgi:hypothetical protein